MKLRMNWRVSISRFIDVIWQRANASRQSPSCAYVPANFSPSSPAFAAQRGIALRIDRQTVLNADDLPSDLRSTQGFSSEFYGEEITEACFLRILDASAHRGEASLEVMCHPAFVDNTETARAPIVTPA